MDAIRKLKPSQVSGRSFTTDEGTTFTALESEHYPQSGIARQHQKYCSYLRDGILFSLSFHGKPVPVVKVKDGVVRIISIKIGDEVISTSTLISETLGITETRQPMGLYRP